MPTFSVASIAAPPTDEEIKKQNDKLIEDGVLPDFFTGIE